MTEIERPNVDTALDHAARHFGGTLHGGRRYGWNFKSAGGEFVRSDGSRRWLRVQFADPSGMHLARWHGETEAERLTGIMKPVVHDHFLWYSEERLWRATVTSLSESAAVSGTQELRESVLLPADWFAKLRTSLKNLSGQPTTRNFCRQVHIGGKIRDAFGCDIDTTVTRWAVCHGDLHWANVGRPDPILFDWEHWGRGPLGIDPANLLVHTVLRPDVAGKVMSAFADVLATRDGLVAILFACAEASHLFRGLKPQSPNLREPIEALARRTIAELSIR